jgi:type IV pilus assembly protein PilM
MSYLEKFYQITEPLIGVDIGYQSLKIVQLNRQAFPPKLIAFSSAPIPVKGMTSGNRDHSAEIAKIIVKCMAEARPRRIHGKYVVSGLPESRVFTKIIDVPTMSAKEMEIAIPHEASRHIPLPLEEIYLDYQPLNLKKNKMESILFVAAPQKLVEKYLNVLRLANLEPIALETKPIAAGRSLIAPGESQPTLIVDIGAEATGISVFDLGTLKFTYTIPHGGFTFTKAIANFLNVDFEQAEKIKRVCGVSNQCKYGNLLSALQPILADILEEITNAIKFYEHRAQPNRRITNIRLCGGGANTKGLAEYLYQQMKNKIKVTIGNPLINLNQRSTRKMPPAEILHFTTAIGLALREKY